MKESMVDKLQTIKDIKKNIETNEKLIENMEQLTIIVKGIKQQKDQMNDDEEKEENEWNITEQITLKWLLGQLKERSSTKVTNKNPEQYHSVNDQLKLFINLLRDYQEIMEHKEFSKELFENIETLSYLQERGNFFKELMIFVSLIMASMVSNEQLSLTFFPKYEGHKQELDKTKPKQFILYEMIVRAMVHEDLSVCTPIAKVLAQEVPVSHVRHCGALSMIHHAMVEQPNTTLKIRFLEFVMDLMHTQEASIDDEVKTPIWDMVDIILVELMNPDDPLTLLNTFELVNQLIAHAQKVQTLKDWFFSTSKTFVRSQTLLSQNLRDPLLGHACLHALGQMAVLLSESTFSTKMDPSLLNACFAYLDACEDEVTMALLIRVIGALCSYQSSFLSYLSSTDKLLLCVSHLTSSRRLLFNASLHFLATLFSSKCLSSSELAQFFNNAIPFISSSVIPSSSASHLVAFLLDAIESSQQNLLLDSRLLIYRLFHSFSLHEFSFKYMCVDYPLCIDRLLNRQLDNERDGQLARFDMFSAFVDASSRFSMIPTPLIIKMKTYVHRGPFFVPPSDAQTKMNDENVL